MPLPFVHFIVNLSEPYRVLRQGDVAVDKRFIGSFLLAVVMAASLAAFGINYLFERRSLALFAINASYNVLTFAIMRTIIGAMQAG